MTQAKIRKKFFDVEMPILKKETQLYGYKIEDLEGRVIILDMTRLLRGKNAVLKLRVEIEDNKAVAKPREMKILPYFIKKMMRKGTNYVEDSFSAQCKDAQIRIKPFLITRRKVSRSVRKALRNIAKEELISYAKGKSYDTIFQDLLKNQIQKTLSLRLKKIYPLSLCEIRILKVEKLLEKTKETKKKEKKTEIEVEEESD